MRISDWSSDVCSSDLPSEGRRRMTRVSLLRAGISPLAFAVPAAAQSMDHSMHGEAPAPTPAPSPTPAPVAQPAPEAPAEAPGEQLAHGNTPGLDMEPEA